MKKLLSIVWILIVASAFAAVATAQDAGGAAGGSGVQLSLNVGGDGGVQDVGAAIQVLLLMTLLTLGPSIVVLMTSFTRIIIVLGFVRTAIGVHNAPSNQIIVGLSLIITFFIMQPVLYKAYDDGIKPLIEERITEEEAVEPIISPFRDFMLKNVRDKDLALFLEIGQIEGVEKAEETPLHALIPAFMISEIRRAFEIGFLLFIPFLIIDMMVASTLMAMGMMMLPPVIISLPFKIVFFVLIDGWHVLTGSLVQSFN